ncbi:trypsin-like peptidase domain-containing protein [Bradyrhizobium sp. 180]|uniref:serine protease n=1 Tax=Bradyrhizobium sp. 180 TaxID=2782650 RepID=UPI001FFB808F|nr:serine protease [Bradyrhizobium sp. 180]MCK1493478.1 trypsin-like peptidase domain-containing protein [Bradyrhizobium sp. 180]
MINQTTVRRPRAASLCSIFCQSVVTTPGGDLREGGATAFLYRDRLGVTWLVTNWHVLTGRRPDDPGHLLEGKPQSPDRIMVTYPAKSPGEFLEPYELQLYRDGKPIWCEYSREELQIDIAAIPIEVPSNAAGITIQDFAEPTPAAIEPGMDVIVVGFPFLHGIDFPYPTWKRAMLATEPAYTVLGTPTILLDMPGHPGMSGSPVYRSGRGFRVTRAQKEAIEAARTDSALKALDMLSPDILSDTTVALELIGIYAGATGNRTMDKLNLGRMFMASLIELTIEKGQPGQNPFPPERYR